MRGHYQIKTRQPRVELRPSTKSARPTRPCNRVASEVFGKNPSFSRTYALLAIAFANKGEDARARASAVEVCRLDPNMKLSTFDDQRASSDVYKEWFENKLVPAWRKAALPE